MIKSVRTLSQSSRGPYYDITGLELVGLIRIVYFNAREQTAGLLAHMEPFIPRIERKGAEKYIEEPPQQSSEVGISEVIRTGEINNYKCELNVLSCCERILLLCSVYDNNSNSTTGGLFKEWGLDESKKVKVTRSIKEEKYSFFGLSYRRKRLDVKVIPANGEL